MALKNLPGAVWLAIYIRVRNCCVSRSVASSVVFRKCFVPSFTKVHHKGHIFMTS